MKKIFFTLLLVVMLSLSFVSASSGSIKTVQADCVDDPNNENHYEIGDEIWIKGSGFDEGGYDWRLMEIPEHDSDPLKSGFDYSVDSSGIFCLNTEYEAQAEDSGVYKAYFADKTDNYHVVPEFGVFIGALTIMSAVGVFFLVRRE